MAEPMHEPPDSIRLTRADYRVLHAALEAALHVLDRSPDSDPDGRARRRAEAGLNLLLRRIWPFLDDLDTDG